MLEVHARRHILADPYQEVMALVSRHPCAEVVGAGARASPGTSNASPVDHGDQSQTPPVLACLN